MKELFERFITDYSEARNKPSTVESNRGYGKLYIVPHLGQMKVPDVTRADISNLMKKMSGRPTNANRVLSAIRKMFKIRPMDPAWSLRSQMDRNPMAWMIQFNGFLVDARILKREFQEEALRQGLIPYVPEKPRRSKEDDEKE